MIVGDVMLVTTGYTGQDIQNFAEEPLVYDLRCERWHRPQLKGLGYKLSYMSGEVMSYLSLDISLVCTVNDAHDIFLKAIKLISPRPDYDNLFITL